jgi:hypothetical protein
MTAQYKLRYLFNTLSKIERAFRNDMDGLRKKIHRKVVLNLAQSRSNTVCRSMIIEDVDPFYSPTNGIHYYQIRRRMLPNTSDYRRRGSGYVVRVGSSKRWASLASPLVVYFKDPTFLERLLVDYEFIERLNVQTLNMVRLK